MAVLRNNKAPWQERANVWFFKKTDPVCGMKEEQGQGTMKHNQWFCSSACLKKYEKELSNVNNKQSSGCCP